MKELEKFYNQGFGWICRRCEAQLKEPGDGTQRSRLLSEGEAESKTPRFSNHALATWKDESRAELFCPRCQESEIVNSES